MSQLRGVLTKHRFSLSFDTDVKEGRVTAICKVTHAAGHTKETKYAVRIGSGPPSSSEAQADGAAYSYAKRGALCSAFNIVVEKDTDGDDARREGDFITKEEANELREKVKQTNADEARFLDCADAKTYEEIRTSRLELLRKMLAKKASAPKLDPRDKDGNFQF